MSLATLAERKLDNVDLIQNPLDAYKPVHLVLFHDGGGTVFSYHLLGDLSRPTWGIANPHYGKETHFFLGIPEMAHRYISDMKKCVPSGKIIIGGWSLGGLTSLEVARILAEDNYYTVLGIVMIDSVCPMAFNKAQSDALVKIVPHVIEWNATTREETKKSILKCFADATEMVMKWTLPSWGDRVRPPPVILIRAKEPVPVVEVGGVSRVDVVRDDLKLGWDMYREDLISQVVEIPGHHYNIFATEWRQDLLTEKIKDACQEIEELYAAKHRR